MLIYVHFYRVYVDHISQTAEKLERGHCGHQTGRVGFLWAPAFSWRTDTHSTQALVPKNKVNIM